MSVNKVIYYGEVLVDMTQVTVKPENLSKGETALDASGKLITGAHECEDLSAEVEEYAEHLDELETTIDTLPEAGGGGGAGVETCTVTVIPDMIPAPPGNEPIFYFTDTNMGIGFLQTENQLFTVAKNTIIAIDNWASNCIANGACEEIFVYGFCGAYRITGDCSFELRL